MITHLPSPTPDATPVPPSPGPQTNPVSREALRVGGTLRLGLPEFPVSWNPWAVSQFDLNPVLDMMTPRFFATAADGTLHWDAAWLAGEPVVTPGEGSTMTVRYDLNPAAVWSDGAPITVADFQATWQTCVATPLPACQDRGFAYVTSIAQGETPSQILISYDRAYAGWPYTFARGPARAETAELAGKSWPSLVDRDAAFSGPYRVIAQGTTTVSLARNPLWWGERPLLDSITVSRIDPASLTWKYLRGDLDAFWLTDVNLYARTASLDGLQTRRSVGGSSRVLLLNCASGPLADPAVRQAVLRGLDRRQLAESDLAGWKWSAAPLNSPLWSVVQPQYVDQVTTAKETYDVKAAKALLDAAGWTEGPDGVRSKYGVELTWTFLVPATDPLAENEAFGLRVQLASLGVGLQLTYVADGTALQSGQYDMAAETILRTTPLAAAERYTAGGIPGYASQSVDRLWQQASEELDPKVQTGTLGRLATLVWQDVPVIPLYEVPATLLVRPSLANYGPGGLGTTLWESVGWTA